MIPVILSCVSLTIFTVLVSVYFKKRKTNKISVKKDK